MLEIGPGYGRLLKSVLEQGVPFKSYLGVDISLQNIDYLKEAFKGQNISFLHGDVENIILDKSFNIMFSSLKFKHLFPSFEKALKNVSRNLVDGGWVFFDLIEGDKRYFEADEVTYIRHYTRQEINEILQRSYLTLVAFDEVMHDEDHVRLLVIGRKLESNRYVS